MPWTPQQLIEFLVAAHQAILVAPQDHSIDPPHRPGFEEYSYTNGDWCFFSSATPGNPKVGEEVVYFEQQPLWAMNYYNFIINAQDRRLIKNFLREALMQRHPDLPVRGEKRINHLFNFRYEIDFDRKDITRFYGREFIYQEGSLAYEGFFHGGTLI